MLRSDTRDFLMQMSHAKIDVVNENRKALMTAVIGLESNLIYFKRVMITVG